MTAPWAHRYPQRTKTVKSSFIPELLKFTTNPEIISFAEGLPAPEVFPAERFSEGCEKVLATAPTAALQCGTSEGYKPLRELIVAQVATYGIVATVDNLLITTGTRSYLQAADQSWRSHPGEVAHLSWRTAGVRPDGRGVCNCPHLTVKACKQGCWRERCAQGRSSCMSCPTSRIRAASRCPKTGAHNWCGCRTSTASPSLKMIRTGSCAMRANPSSR